MLCHLPEVFDSLNSCPSDLVEIIFLEFLPYKVHRFPTGIGHAVIVETIVSQFIYENFVGWEVLYSGVGSAERIAGEEQNGFTA